MDGFIERNKHLNIPESAFFLFIVMFLYERSVWWRYDACGFIIEKQTFSCVKVPEMSFCLFVCLPCTATFSVYFHSNIFIGAVKY